jgi:uncharacterized protein (TIGR02145 family)
VYGRLYDWATAMTACPEGWHLPSQGEWDILSDFVGGSSTAGKHLKATSNWYGDGNGLDTYDFAALPGGNGYPGNSLSFYGYWWSSSESGSESFRSSMSYSHEEMRLSLSYKSSLYSVRCIKN